MIVRMWMARATPVNAGRYRTHFEHAVLPELRGLAGFGGASLLSREHDGFTELAVLTRWRSRDAIRAFAGAELGKAVVARSAAKVLASWDGHVTHYDEVRYDAEATAGRVPRSHVAAVRRFNRFYTGAIGALDEQHLSSQFSLGEVRVLFELAQRSTRTAAEVGAALRLDAGYLSRVIARLEKAKLLVRMRDADDARQRVLALTRAGRKTFADLDARATAEVQKLLGRVAAYDQQRVIDAMTVISTALGPSEERRVTIRQHRAGDLGWITERHGELYWREYKWTEEFEGLVAEICANFVRAADPEHERTWIAEVDGERAGCIMVVRKSRTVAQLRLLLVEPRARGLGLGARLVDECLRFAKAAGYKRIVLWTQNNLHAARTLYERAGFKLVRSGNHRSFGHALVEQTWELGLRAPALIAPK
jgi:DNA-binding MarR family transcriptional regulator/GNAT superfamily N-acetyltransferase/heme-degrading monooxygenase HmoA